MIAELAPRPDVPAGMRRLPAPAVPQLVPGGVGNREVTGEPPLAPAAVVAPLAPARFKVQFTAGEELRDKIARARALLGRPIPSGDLAALTAAPRKSVDEADRTPSSRHIPAPIRRAVWERDGGQCTFHDRLEFHHDVPFGRGGDHSESNVRLACTACRQRGSGEGRRPGLTG